MPTAQQRPATCPNCHAAIPPTARKCSVCKLEVDQMRAFASAKAAARRKGMATTQVEDSGPPFYKNLLRPIVIFPAVLAILLIYYLARPAAPGAWTRLPKTQLDAAREILTDISQGDPGYVKAYDLIAPSAKNPKDRDDIGRYRQLFHVMNTYLSTEFGSDWITTLNLQADKNNNDLIEAHIGAETLHLRAVLQTPADKLKDDNRHYAIEGFDEFDIHDAADMQKMAAITGLVGGVAGPAALNNLETILGAAGGGGHRESPMTRKLRILPNLRNPRAAVRRTVLQAWPLRHDPVIRARLQSIIADGRFQGDVIETAKQVLQDNVPEEDLIAAGVE
jgi:hypothetical protein